MRARLALVALLLIAAPVFAQSNGWQEIQNGWGEVQTVPGYSVMPAPSGCISTSVPFFGVDLKLTCDAGLTYDAATDTLTPTNLAAGTLVMAGTGTARARIGGVLHVNTAAASTVTTARETLATYTLPANTLSENGKAIRITAWGGAAPNANTKLLFLALNGGTIASVSTTISGLGWQLCAVVVRTGVAAQTSIGQSGTGTSVRHDVYTPALDTTAAIVVTMDATTATAAGDVTFRGMIVEALN